MPAVSVLWAVYEQLHVAASLSPPSAVVALPLTDAPPLLNVQVGDCCRPLAGCEAQCHQITDLRLARVGAGAAICTTPSVGAVLSKLTADASVVAVTAVPALPPDPQTYHKAHVACRVCALGCVRAAPVWEAVVPLLHPSLPSLCRHGTCCVTFAGCAVSMLVIRLTGIGTPDMSTSTSQCSENSTTMTVTRSTASGDATSASNCRSAAPSRQDSSQPV